MQLHFKLESTNSFFHPGVGRDPVYFPGLASIIRECLFKTARIRSDVRNNKSNKDGSAIECFLTEELAASILDSPLGGWPMVPLALLGKMRVHLRELGFENPRVKPSK